MPELTLLPVSGFPLVRPGDDLARLIVTHVELQEHDVVVVAQKVVSKSEGRLVRLRDVVPSERAVELAAQAEKDPRLVEIILRESNAVLRLRPGLIVVEHRNGYVCANAGVDRSNVVQAGDAADDEMVCLLPEDADASAQQLRDDLRRLTGRDVAVIVNDSHGRAFRDGIVGVAIGVAGLAPLQDDRGRRDLFGYELKVTVIARADELAAAASLLMGQADEGQPVVVIRGYAYEPAEGSVRPLIRPRERDMFR